MKKKYMISAILVSVMLLTAAARLQRPRFPKRWRKFRNLILSRRMSREHW